ncbi:MAG: helix-turn-helix domain-containing protein, partial [Acidimicrobiales bacterium]
GGLTELAAAGRERTTTGAGPRRAAGAWAGGWSPLTDRERDVLGVLAQGASTAQVAAQLYISPKTAKNHLASIYAKLDAGSRTQALVQAARLGLVSLGRA